eukprot:TRINITY_DN16976_c0_g1_i1.p1 TRINITY_DN16976_c0_g1~~TRINITY_DN16976_c0_g1_i1.p1  ORF type:complete len:853 (+),score=278.66 TRINITY_DN16976_c0_g1_i1:51-2609(+)
MKGASGECTRLLPAAEKPTPCTAPARAAVLRLVAGVCGLQAVWHAGRDGAAEWWAAGGPALAGVLVGVWHGVLSAGGASTDGISEACRRGSWMLLAAGLAAGLSAAAVQREGSLEAAFVAPFRGMFPPERPLPLPPAAAAAASLAGGAAVAAVIAPYFAEVVGVGRGGWAWKFALVYTITFAGAAAEADGLVLGYPFPSAASLLLGARVPAVLCGTIAARRFLHTSAPVCVLAAAAAVLATAWITVLFLPRPRGLALRSWAGHGMLAPLYAGAVLLALQPADGANPAAVSGITFAADVMLHSAVWFGAAEVAAARLRLSDGFTWGIALLLWSSLSVAAVRVLAAVWGRGDSDCHSPPPEPEPLDEAVLRRGLISASAHRRGWRRAAALLSYYAAFAGFMAAYVYASFANPAQPLPLPGWMDESMVHVLPVLRVVRWGIVLSFPALLVGTVAHLAWPAAVPSAAVPPGFPAFRGRLHVRIVTKGTSPELVRDTAAAALRVLSASPLPSEQAVVEVVTDLQLPLDGLSVAQLVVPDTYRCPNGALFKARALEYAVQASTAQSGDWVLHLDEETRLCGETLRQVLWHCVGEDAAVLAGERPLQRIGQGPIVYGSRPADVENWLTTLADSGRVADDFGKFRLSFAMHVPIFGMHGSFVAIAQDVEERVGWDHGPEGSITEDAFFAVVAWKRGAGVAWIDSFMFEQSPFTVTDFMKQRRRWFSGLVRLCWSDRVRDFRRTAILRGMVAIWAVCALAAPLTIPSVLIIGSADNPAFHGLLVVCAALWTWQYVLGFLISYAPSEVGVLRWAVLACVQLVCCPLFLCMEVGGVVWAFFDWSAFTGFHVVRKQRQERKPSV